MILAIKTSNDPAEIYLLDPAGKILAQKIWSPERRLARDLLGEIERLVIASEAKQSSDNDLDRHVPHQSGEGTRDDKWRSLSGIIVFRGPGSFTGLRIGITTANTIAYALKIPIVGTNGENWLDDGMKKLAKKLSDKIVLPEYGAPANITKPRVA
jgi:tRNA threonylcarbamoyl adenosine modification protein YeaZ